MQNANHFFLFWSVKTVDSVETVMMGLAMQFPVGKQQRASILTAILNTVNMKIIAGNERW